MTDWLSQLRNAERSCITDKNLKKVHYLFDKNMEMVEEYNLDTGVLTRRAWKTKTKFAGEGDWDIEIGDPEPTMNREKCLIKEDCSQPFVTRRITKTTLEWRIRNLPYPIETYIVQADPESKCLVVQTTNKKYFKKLPVPDLERINVAVQQDAIQFIHKYNTLIITYKKPKELVEIEKLIFADVKELKSKSEDMNNCKVS